MQIQDDVQDDEDPEVFNNMVVWDEDAHPWQDLAVIDIDKTLDWKDSLLTTFSVNNMPKTLGVLPANSIYDYNSLNYLRAHSELARMARSSPTSSSACLRPSPTTTIAMSRNGANEVQAASGGIFGTP